jgi:hypothetical protein
MSALTIVFDIEVAGFPWEEVDEITRGYLLQRETDKDGATRCPSAPGSSRPGKVIAIGLWLVGQDAKGQELDRGLILLEGTKDEEHAWEKVPGTTHLPRRREEAAGEVLGDRRAAQRGSAAAPGELQRPRLRRADADDPLGAARAAALARPPAVPLRHRRALRPGRCAHFLGAYHDRYSLDYWCRRFDIESPKGSIDGSQVARAYRDGRIEDIGEYCLRDVRATAQLYQKLETTILPLFKGGPR